VKNSLRPTGHFSKTERASNRRTPLGEHGVPNAGYGRRARGTNLGRGGVRYVFTGSRFQENQQNGHFLGKSGERARWRDWVSETFRERGGRRKFLVPEETCGPLKLRFHQNTGETFLTQIGMLYLSGNQGWVGRASEGLPLQKRYLEYGTLVIPKLIIPYNWFHAAEEDYRRKGQNKMTLTVHPFGLIRDCLGR